MTDSQFELIAGIILEGAMEIKKTDREAAERFLSACCMSSVYIRNAVDRIHQNMVNENENRS